MLRNDINGRYVFLCFLWKNSTLTVNIKDVTVFEIPGLTIDEIIEMKNSIVCYQIFVPCPLYVYIVPLSINTVNTSRQRQNGRHFTTEFLEFRLKFHGILFLGGQINNIPALVQIMAWCRPGDKPLPKPMMVSLLTLICVTRPQWVNVIPWVRNNLGSPPSQWLMAW